MQPLPQLQEAEAKVLADISRVLNHIRDAAKRDVTSVGGGISILVQLRQRVYEDLNQIQHEHLILRAAEWLRRSGLVGVQSRCFWNPRQTGDAAEPDLAIFLGERQVISAEVTAAERPIGAIDKRMAHTLRKLSDMPGDRFYFVRTEEMRLRAETKIRKAGSLIRVIILQDV